MAPHKEAWVKAQRERAMATPGSADLTSNPKHVQGLLVKYGQGNGVVGRPYERVLNTLSQIDQFIMREKKPGALTDLMLEVKQIVQARLDPRQP